MTPQNLMRIETSLRDQMLNRLASRWPKAAAYIPSGTTRVQCTGKLREDEQENLDLYVLAYEEAIVDFMRMLDKDDGRPAPAANPAFPDRLPPRRAPKPERAPRKPAPGRGVRRNSAARQRLEDLFRGGNDEV
ncbi:hypothetical protein ACMHYJ_05225 [Castellaniella hirudinis]|uniref:hypothetical protein n=1 Tax=Castellaniella hirudinis TaxID=1144617 RepID=UPI0039C012AC